MAKITWTIEAERWLRDIYGYIAADNPRAAAAVVEGIYERAHRLGLARLGFSYTATIESLTS